MASRGIKAAPRGKPSGLPFHARFTDVAAQAGLQNAVISGHREKADYVLEAMSCGAAFFDYDNDGWLDILILSGSRFGDPPPDASTRLYKNNRDGTFTDVTRKAGLFRTGYSYGVTVGDYNNDGFEDLFLTGWGQNALYRNNGDGTFTEVTKEAGLINAQARFGSGCAFVDYDRDGRLDLFVSNYLAFDMNSVPRAGQSKSCNVEGVFCGPRGLPYGRHSLYHNNGDGTFTDVTEAAGIGKAPGGYGLTVVAADFDNDGWPDIYVACDSTPSLMFHNNHDGTFTEQALETRSRTERRRHGAGRHGSGCGRYPHGRKSSHRQDAFRGRHSGGVLQRRQGQFSGRSFALRPGSGNAFRHLGRGCRGPGQ